LKDLLFLFWVFLKVLFAKKSVEAMSTVAAILTTKKAPMFVLTIPAIKGFNSTAPEYRTPITVVKQSIVPIKRSTKYGIASFFSILTPSRFLYRTLIKS
jgi:hypothetical protein